MAHNKIGDLVRCIECKYVSFELKTKASKYTIQDGKTHRHLIARCLQGSPNPFHPDNHLCDINCFGDQHGPASVCSCFEKDKPDHIRCWENRLNE